MYFGLVGFGLLAALVGSVIGLVIEVLFLLNLMGLLQAVRYENRAMSPGLVWLNLIPVFNLGWMIYTVIKIRDSVHRESASRWGSSVDEGNTHTVGLVYAVLAAVAFVFSYGSYANRGVSVFAGLVSLAVLVSWIMYWVKTHGLKKELQRTAGPGYRLAGPYGYGGQYGPGGPYSPGGAGYGAGGPSYGPGGPGYGAAYVPGITGQADAGPPAWQPLQSSQQPDEEDSENADVPGEGRACSQCGRAPNPDDQFCTSCGMPVPKD